MSIPKGKKTTKLDLKPVLEETDLFPMVDMNGVIPIMKFVTAAIIKAFAGGGGGAGGGHVFVYRPNGVASENVYTDADLLMTAVDAFEGTAIIEFDNLGGTPGAEIVMPNRVYNFSNTVLRGQADDFGVGSVGPEPQSIRFVNGATWSGLPDRIELLTIVVDNTTPLFNITGIKVITMDSGVIFIKDGGVLFTVDSNALAIFIVLNFSSLGPYATGGPHTGHIFDFQNSQNATLFFILLDMSGLLNIEDNFITGGNVDNSCLTQMLGGSSAVTLDYTKSPLSFNGTFISQRMSNAKSVALGNIGLPGNSDNVEDGMTELLDLIGGASINGAMVLNWDPSFVNPVAPNFDLFGSLFDFYEINRKYITQPCIVMVPPGAINLDEKPSGTYSLIYFTFVSNLWFQDQPSTTITINNDLVNLINDIPNLINVELNLIANSSNSTNPVFSIGLSSNVELTRSIISCDNTSDFEPISIIGAAGELDIIMYKGSKLRKDGSKELIKHAGTSENLRFKLFEGSSVEDDLIAGNSPQDIIFDIWDSDSDGDIQSNYTAGSIQRNYKIIKDYLVASIVGGQSPVGAVDIQCNVIGARKLTLTGGGIDFNLRVGKTYLLSAFLKMTVGSGAGSRFAYQWISVAGDSFNNIAGESVDGTVGGNSGKATGVIGPIINPGTIVKLRVISVVATPTIDAAGSIVEITEL